MRPNSIEQLEGDSWPEPGSGVSSLVIKCHEARKKPIESLTPSDLRALISQGISQSIVMPKALALLQTDPMLDADYFEGDLLLSVLGVAPEYWNKHPSQKQEVLAVLKRATQGLAMLDASEEIHQKLSLAIGNFPR
jgi:hypothetical protein